MSHRHPCHQQLVVTEASQHVQSTVPHGKLQQSVCDGTLAILHKAVGHNVKLIPAVSLAFALPKLPLFMSLNIRSFAHKLSLDDAVPWRG